MNRSVFVLLMMTVFYLASWGNSASAYYDPQNGRWLNRDPAGEYGGMGIYLYKKNNAISMIEFLGMYTIEDAYDKYIKDLGYNPCKNKCYQISSMPDLIRNCIDKCEIQTKKLREFLIYGMVWKKVLVRGGKYFRRVHCHCVSKEIVQ